MAPSARSNVPLISLGIVEYLEALYPDRAPNITDTERMVWFKAGQVDAAKKIRHQYEIQNRLEVRSE
jgi:hypothetical protein